MLQNKGMQLKPKFIFRLYDNAIEGFLITVDNYLARGIQAVSRSPSLQIMEIMRHYCILSYLVNARSAPGFGLGTDGWPIP